MLSVASVSLSGGQGKSTCALFLGRMLAQIGYSTLMVDADPQASLTMFLSHEVEPSHPTVLELLKGDVPAEEAIYPVNGIENLFLVPADEGLEVVQEFLASSGCGASMMRNQLEPVHEAFKVCILDSPPQKSQLCRTVMGAAHQIVIPAEATLKGYSSLVRTLDAIEQLRRWKATIAQVLGIIPFRDRWFGYSQSLESRMCIAEMKELVGDKLLPSIRESEQFKKAIGSGKNIKDIAQKDLAYPFEILTKKVVNLIENV